VSFLTEDPARKAAEQALAGLDRGLTGDVDLRAWPADLYDWWTLSPRPK
jgi:hypothetical protein